MNTASCDMVRVADSDAVDDGPPGAFYIETYPSGHRVMWHKLPSGHAGCIRLAPVAPGQERHPAWNFDGNEDKPTLTPSVHYQGHWHGFFRNGRMESC